MKRYPFACLAGLVLATAAQAETHTAEAPAPSGMDLWQWFAGGSAGYLTELDEGMYHMQFGVEFQQTPGARAIHAFYLELGFTRDDAAGRWVSNLPGGVSWEFTSDLDIIPITLNYSYQFELTERLGGFIGLGAGVALLDSSHEWRWFQAVPPPNHTGSGGGDDSEAVFYGNLFAGLSYDVTESFAILAGVRYIFMDNKDMAIDIAGIRTTYEGGIDGDVLIELGARFRF